MGTPQEVSDMYRLKWLHEEIDLYDRKLAHLEKYSQEGSEAERGRMEKKRSALEKTARKLAAEHTEFDPKALPRSFRTEETTA